MKTKTSELTGAALDWAVAKCEGCSEYLLQDFIDGIWSCANYKRYSTDWAQGGPIIERENICLLKVGIINWKSTTNYGIASDDEKYGTTPLIAAMRCYVSSKLGDTVEIPDELI